MPPDIPASDHISRSGRCAMTTPSNHAPEASGQPGGAHPVGNANETLSCEYCTAPLTGRASKRYCSPQHRLQAWRQSKVAPVTPRHVPKADIVYECGGCGERRLGEQRCPDCNLWCQRIGPGGLCPCCDAPVALTELLAPDPPLVRQRP